MGDKWNSSPSLTSPCRQEAVPVLVVEPAGLAASQLFYLLWEVDQGSEPGLVHWFISLASVGAGHSRVDSQTALMSTLMEDRL